MLVPATVAVLLSVSVIQRHPLMGHWGHDSVVVSVSVCQSSNTSHCQLAGQTYLQHCRFLSACLLFLFFSAPSLFLRLGTGVPPLCVSKNSQQITYPVGSGPLPFISSNPAPTPTPHPITLSHCDKGSFLNLETSAQM